MVICCLSFIILSLVYYLVWGTVQIGKINAAFPLLNFQIMSCSLAASKGGEFLNVIRYSCF